MGEIMVLKVLALPLHLSRDYSQGPQGRECAMHSPRHFISFIHYPPSLHSLPKGALQADKGMKVERATRFSSQFAHLAPCHVYSRIKDL